ncbi:iron-containing alcohol dehydrogenase [Marinobacter salicampi]|uniref:iron-containing alcohol dehydrogenase n=1 Tax=Marinobacter salicampi TaxID=435907 RepID=UPI00140D48AD|nr:iron-containing alcohol dehydrogenase [Marinobacter salicampi]
MSNQLNPFGVAALPRIVFGKGVFDQLVPAVAALGNSLLIVTGSQSFRATGYWLSLVEQLEEAGVRWRQVSVKGEPSPHQVDQVVAEYGGEGINCVLAIGGGSALDAGKAIAGLLTCQRPVSDFLEGVGRPEDYTGPAVPFVAVPTTAGTGSELTRNAVITQAGPGGFKKSFRDDRLLPRLALVDPSLLESCPASVMLGNALDAVTQLLEAYASPRASAFTDALAADGLRAFALGFRPDPDHPVRDFSQLAYAAMLSGICLTQAGLGSVHGFASPLGAFFGIPHGMACGTMLAACTEANIRLLQAREPVSPALAKYREVWRILTPEGSGDTGSPEALAQLLHHWTEACHVPRLSTFGISQADLPTIVAASGGNSMRTNPLVLTESELLLVLEQRL